MTNSEAIKLIKGILPRKISYANLIGVSSCYGDKYVYESPESYALELAISALEENTKLKAEIEQFADELISVRIENELLKKKNELTNHYFEQYSDAIDEIEQLKSELEQHKKFKEYFMELYDQGLEVSNWHLNGDLELLTNFIDSALEEAEQHLKGKVEE